MSTATLSDSKSLPQPVSMPDKSVSRTADNDDSRLWVSPTAVFSKSHLMAEVDPARSTLPLAAYCFMTGFMFVSSCLAICVGLTFSIVWIRFQQ